MEESSAEQNSESCRSQSTSLAPCFLAISVIDIHKQNVLKGEEGLRMMATSFICTSNGVCYFCVGEYAYRQWW